jgi:hypothetical protein
VNTNEVDNDDYSSVFDGVAAGEGQSAHCECQLNSPITAVAQCPSTLT